MLPSKSALCAMILGAALAGGCGAAPVPAAKVASSAAAIRTAQEIQAGDTSASQDRLQRAIDEYAEAQKIIAESGGGERAELLLERAQADADLAVALAKEARSGKAAAAAQAELQNVNAK